MKKIYTLVTILFAFVCSAQTTTSYQLTSKNQVGLTSPKKDTLYLINDELGLTIKGSWYMKDTTGHDLYPEKPHFVFLPKDKFIRKLNNRILTEKTKSKTQNR